MRDGVTAVEEALDFVAAHKREDGYLVGGAFSLADLVAAAHLAPCIEPPHPDTRRPTPRPGSVERFLARWRAHPATEWVLEVYRRHRPPHDG